MEATAYVLTVLGQIPGGAMLQYGALGLCAILVGMLGLVIKLFWANVKHLSGVIEKKDKLASDQAREFTSAIRELTTVLRNRPCLLNSTLQEGGGG